MNKSTRKLAAIIIIFFLFLPLLMFIPNNKKKLVNNETVATKTDAIEEVTTEPITIEETVVTTEVTTVTTTEELTTEIITTEKTTEKKSEKPVVKKPTTVTTQKPTEVVPTTEQITTEIVTTESTTEITTEVTTEVATEKPTEKTDLSYDKYGGLSASDFNLICKVVENETHGADKTSKSHVVNVIRNRKKDSRFPNSYSGVINQPNQFGKRNDVTESTKKAVREALANGDNTHGALWFCTCSRGCWASSHATRIFKDSVGHIFWK